jgi:mRNA-degrading endonuclease toxin of MazEF toxin-antitoxin module
VLRTKGKSIQRTSYYPPERGDLTKDSIAIAEQVRAIAKTRLRLNIGQLRLEHMNRLSTALKIAMDLP